MSLILGLLGWGVLVAFLASLAWVISTHNRLAALRSEVARARSELLRLSEDPATNETRIGSGRRELNDGAQAYNRAIAVFPAVAVAAALGFRREVTEPPEL